MALTAGNIDDADDIVQTAMLKAIERKEQFRADTNLLAWVKTIVKHTFLDRQKSHSISRTDSLEFDTSVPGEQMGAVELAECQEWMDNNLTKLERQANYLHSIGYKYQEGADEMGITHTYYGVILRRSREKLEAIKKLDN